MTWREDKWAALLYFVILALVGFAAWAGAVLSTDAACSKPPVAAIASPPAGDRAPVDTWTPASAPHAHTAGRR